MYMHTQKNYQLLTVIVLPQSCKCSELPSRERDQFHFCPFAVFALNQLLKVINRRETVKSEEE